MNEGSLVAPVTPQVPTEGDLVEEEMTNKEKRIAALSVAPGWDDFAARIRNDIASLKSGENIDFAALDDEKLGQVLRVEHMVAERLEKYLTMVEQTADAVAEIEGDGESDE